MNEISNKQSASTFITGLSYIFPDEIASEVRSGNKVWLTMNDGKALIPIYFTPGTAKLTCTSNTQFEGKRIVNQFEVSLPGSGADFEKELKRICAKSIVLSITFSDGKVLLAGGKYKKLRLEYKSTSDVVSGYLLSFDYTVSEPFRILD
jgi:hypothetical protein